MKKHKQTIKFDRIFLANRWRRSKFGRNSDWTIIGISKWWSGPENFCYKLCLFGFEVNIWFTRIFN